MIRCPECLMENEQDATTCSACGEALMPPEESATQASPDESAPSTDTGDPLYFDTLPEETIAEEALPETILLEETPVAAAAETTPLDATAELTMAQDENEDASPEPVEASPPLPEWLQQLKPAESEPATDEIEDRPLAVTAELPATHEPDAPWPAGTDLLVDTQASDTTPQTAPESAAIETVDRIVEEPVVAANTPAAKPGSETASLITEDDLPAWLRAFGTSETKQQSVVDDQSWMVGGEQSASASLVAEDLAQSWQSPARQAPAVQRTSAATVFAHPAEDAPRVEKVERVITVPQEEAGPATHANTVERSLPRPTLAPRPERSTIQRWALLTFIVALVIFLAVLGIFVVGPALIGS